MCWPTPGHPGRARRPLREQRQRGDGRGHAGRVGQLSAARRRHLEVDRRHQCRLRCARQPRLGRRHRRRADHRRRGLRRRLLDHAGAQPRVRDEVADLAARPAARTCRRSCTRSKTGFELSEASQHAGDARAAHPRLPRARPLRRQGQPAAGVHAEGRDGEAARATSAASCCRPPASCTSRRRSTSAGRRRVRFIKERGLNEFFGERRATTSASSCRAAATTPCCARSSGSAWPTSSATRRSRST